MSRRPYFNKSVVELEAIFQNSQFHKEMCQDILYELGFRKSKRAAKLKNDVVAFCDSNNTRDASATRPAVKSRCPEASLDLKENSENPTGHPKVVNPLPKSELGPKPQVANDPQDILRAWTALEVMGPQGYRREADLAGGDRYRIARLDTDQLPWERGEKSRPKKRLYYELILGTINLGPAIESLLKIYTDNRPDTPGMNRRSPIASILLDKKGRPLEEISSIAVSSFAWGVPIALQGDLKRLADWPIQDRRLLKVLQRELIKRDGEGEILPLTKRSIRDLYEMLTRELHIESQDISPPAFAIRRYEYFASKVPPEPGLLNSFFLEDLAEARELARSKRLPRALRYYLGVELPDKKTDLLQDQKGLQDLLQPALTPLGRWPSNGRFSLTLLQQAAVNGTTASVQETGMLSVNGPPGTGKTTLLRDIVAARLVERAIVMAEYANPISAFKPSSLVLQRGGAKITLYHLDDRLKGFEMVVASSNNKAVENVSAELPSIDAIASDAPELQYFKSISDSVLQRDTWGMIAAVLGNSSNRYLFSQSFWRDEENGLSTYLNHIAGVPQFVSEPQSDGPPVKRPRQVIAAERPPNNLVEALASWKNARLSFLEVLHLSRTIQDRLQVSHKKIKHLDDLDIEITELQTILPQLILDLEADKSQLRGIREKLVAKEQLVARLGCELHSHMSTRPGLVARVFRTNKSMLWRTDNNRLAQSFHEQEVLQKQIQMHSSTQEERVLGGRNELNGVQDNLLRLQAEYQDLGQEIEELRSEIDAQIPDRSFFNQDRESIQMASLWFSKTDQVVRDRVFEKSMALHRAFVDCTADPIRQNLSIFMETFGTRSLGTPQKDAIIPDLWASFFMVVPVVSTTFASVNRMFSRLAPDTLGWLLIDEAGQALPQAAVGAIMRAKRVVAVGDPLQIEPVVTLPNSLTEEICGFFGVDPLKFDAPNASVQSVADLASPYCARFPIASGHRDVGVPLLVHRRCESPMFDVSNEIAYSNLMVQAKKPSLDANVLGPSCWYDVIGKPGPDKWCADEGGKLIELLGLMRSKGNEADLYVVTLFVIVQDNLRKELLASRVLDGWVTSPRAWVSEHVGTVHTVQGREAETVFFVLGAQLPSQNGARAWAGGRPNLVNVAVTRAKKSLYVIGNRELWKSAGVFSALDQHLDHRR